MALGFSCTREMVEAEGPENGECLPDGVPVTLYIPFDGKEFYDVTVRTKAESSAADEARIHDLYVMIFDNNNKVTLEDGTQSARKIYGRYFSHVSRSDSLLYYP